MQLNDARIAYTVIPGTQNEIVEARIQAMKQGLRV